MNKRRSRVCEVTTDIFVHGQHVASHYGLIVNGLSSIGDRADEESIT